ncbi:DUF397 domain-containing protein [Streptosporangium roseum]|uniref:DUF397 domain-containing protein n=1 Tax=Streptosporangium roseum TaxID=2001 RepID=UPI0004CCF6DD|nr:DUF397 domain-containing protein [Streptosporangium roseum]
MESTHQNHVIVGPFRKSSLSDNSGNCVEVAPTQGGGCAVRDSKDQGGPVLFFTGPEWAAFVGGVKGGEFG